MTSLADTVQMYHEKQENTKKTPIFGTYQKNGDALVVYNHTESYLIIIQHYLGT